MTFVLPDLAASEIVLPALPDAISPALRDAADRYLAGFWGDGSDESGAAWTAAAQDVAACSPASLADVAAKLLLITHYVHPTQRDGVATVDLDAFDADTGRMLLRCVGEIMTFAEVAR